MNILPNKKKEKIAIYIDGSNFYKYLKNKEVNFPKGVKFDFSKFIDFLVGERKLVSKRYYVGIARNFNNSEKSKRIVSGQQKFLTKIENEGFKIKRGKIMYYLFNFGILKLSIFSTILVLTSFTMACQVK